jgi:hypothetical protein
MPDEEADKATLEADLQSLYERRAQVRQSLNIPGKTDVQIFGLESELSELEIKITRKKKELKSLSDIPPATNGNGANGGQPTTTNPPDINARPQLSPAEQRDLIELFLACPILKTPGGRQAVNGQLPTDISNNISLAATNTPKMEVTNILQACLNVPGGLAALYDAVRFYDDNTFPFTDLTNFLRARNLV